MGVDVDISVEADGWKKLAGVKAVIEKALQAACEDFGFPRAEFSVLLTGDGQIQALNNRWRGIDKPTNVLSFPAPNRREGFFGDIVLSHETVAREAAGEGKDILHHVAHLAVHAALHLFGLDHQDDAGADAMENREREILARLGIPDPYASSGRRLAEPA